MGMVGRILVAALEQRELEKMAWSNPFTIKPETGYDKLRRYASLPFSPYAQATKGIPNTINAAKHASWGGAFSKGLTGLFSYMALSEFGKAVKEGVVAGKQARANWGV